MPPPPPADLNYTPDTISRHWPIAGVFIDYRPRPDPSKLDFDSTLTRASPVLTRASSTLTRASRL